MSHAVPTPAQVPGLDTEAVSAWLAGRIPSARPPFAFARIGDGRSNLTFRVSDDAGATWILRRPPLGKILPKAHDMLREHRILAALHPAGVPVPEPLGVCEDTSVSGAAFYVMEHRAGVVLATPEDAAPLSEDVRRRAGLSLVETLARLHAVDVDAVGLGDLGPRDDYAARQVRRWTAQWERTDGDPLPAIERTGELLAASLPAQTGASIVHGDYKLENVIVDGRGEISAILDWELCALGDPLADLAWVLLYWSSPGAGPGVSSVAAAAGFPTEAEIIQRYAEVSGRDLSALPFYRALSAWKLAIIFRGVISRFRDTPENANVDPASLVPLVDALAATALETAETLSEVANARP